MVSWKTLFLGVWATIWVFIAIGLTFTILGGAVETCSTGSEDFRSLEEDCETEWSAVVLISVLLVAGLLAAFLAVRSLLASIREDRHRSIGHSD